MPFSLFMSSRSSQNENQLGIRQDELAILREVCQAIPAIESVQVFGSRAMGTNHYNSDFDLVVQGEQVDRTTISLLQEKLEDQLFPYRFDILQAKTITHKELRNHIAKYGKTIYQRAAETTSS